MLSSVLRGSGSLAVLTPSSPAICRSHIKGAFSASRAASVASTISGPMPSPGMRVAGIDWVMDVSLLSCAVTSHSTRSGALAMDQEKLKRLRARYTDRDVFDGDDPVLTRAARDVQSPDGKRSLPYSGVPTFLGLPYATSAADLDIAVVGVPMDLGVSNRAGARFGPRAVRTIERIGPYHPTLRGVPKSRARAADIGDVPFRSRYSLEQSLEDIERYYAALKTQGVRTLSV